MQPPLFSDANHDVIDFEICAFRKITEIWFRERIFFVQIKKKSLITHKRLLYGKISQISQISHENTCVTVPF